MGYYRPVTTDAYQTTQWNLGKVSEHLERKYFKDPTLSGCANCEGQGTAICDDCKKNVDKTKQVA
jgi:hypothetical protein